MLEIKIDKKSRNILTNMSRSVILRKYMRDAIKMGFILLGNYTTRLIKKRILDPPKTGKWYVVPKKLRKMVGRSMHQASKPGEPPADYTKRLRKYTHFVSKVTQLEVGYDTKTPYGRVLELGNKGAATSIIIRKRPNIEPVCMKSSREGEKYFKHQINTQFSKIDKVSR